MKKIFSTCVRTNNLEQTSEQILHDPKVFKLSVFLLYYPLFYVICTFYIIGRFG